MQEYFTDSMSEPCNQEGYYFGENWMLELTLFDFCYNFNHMKLNLQACNNNSKTEHIVYVY